MSLYNYKAKVLRIVDGDTISLEIDMGMKIYFKSNCRLSGINAPELNSKDHLIAEKAVQATIYLKGLLPISSIVDLQSISLDKYGRSIGQITTKEGVVVNDEMVKSGNAVVYK